MMKKFVLAALAMFATAGLTIAAVVTLIKADEKKVTVKGDEEGAKEIEYDLKDVKFSQKGKDATKDVTPEAALKMLANEKSWGKAKLDITLVDKKLTELKFMGKMKK